MPKSKGTSYYDVLTEAINDISENGFDSTERIAYWAQRLRDSAVKTMVPEHEMRRMLRDGLEAMYRKMIERGGIDKYHFGVSRFTIERLAPTLRNELDRRIMASASLIKLNRDAAIEKTLQRFAGWSTSVPKGGSEAVDKTKTKKDIRKSLVQLPFEERRVLIDQGHKFAASLNETIAKGNNALAAIWHSHWRQAGYDYREDHKERDQRAYMLKSNWAQAQGLAKPGPDGYYEDITAVGEEPFCRCYASWIYNLRDLPKAMLTKKGADKLLEAQKALT